jgi:hypothetical protein
LKDLNLDKQNEIMEYVVNFMHEIIQTITGCDTLKDNAFNTLWSEVKEKIENLAKNKSSKIYTNISKEDNDNSSLKQEKDAFINKLAESHGVELFDELKEYLE